MVYIQVYIPDKGEYMDFRIDSKLNIATLKGLIIECVYNIRYDEDFVKSNYILIDFYSRKRLIDDLTLDDYAIYNGYRLLLI